MQDDQNPANTLDNGSPVGTPLGDNSNFSSTQPSAINTQPLDDSTTPILNNVADTANLANQQEASPLSTSPIISDADQKQNFGENIVTAPHAPKKYGGKKIIATIFGVLILIGAVITGVYLVQREQDLREDAASGSACDQSPDCVLVDNAQNSGSKTVERQITYVDITDQEYHHYESGETDDGCRKVNITRNTVTWEKYGDGPNCKDVSNVQIWMGNEQPTNTPTLPPGETPTATPVITEPPSTNAECSNVKAYDTSWNLLSQTQLNQLEAGTIIRFSVSGTANSGSFDKARFGVNSVSLGETTLKKPGSEEFYIEYIIPDGIISFNVDAQIHHSELGWF